MDLLCKKFPQPGNFLKTILIFGERFYLQIVLLKPTKTHILKTLVKWSRMATEDV